MKLYVDNQELHFSEDDLDEYYVDEGQEAVIYHYGDYAYKIYKSHCPKYRLEQEDCEMMMTIPTEKILLPRGIIFDENHRFTGYYTNFIEKQPTHKILDLKLKNFISQLDDVYQDIQLLSENHILVHDMSIPNFCYHDGFYFVDPGSYLFVDDFPTSFLDSFNREAFTNFLVQEIFGKTLSLSRKKVFYLKNYLNEFSYISDALVEESVEESVKKYVKNIPFRS